MSACVRMHAWIYACMHGHKRGGCVPARGRHICIYIYIYIYIYTHTHTNTHTHSNVFFFFLNSKPSVRSLMTSHVHTHTDRRRMPELCTLPPYKLLCTNMCINTKTLKHAYNRRGRPKLCPTSSNVPFASVPTFRQSSHIQHQTTRRSRQRFGHTFNILISAQRIATYAIIIVEAWRGASPSGFFTWGKHGQNFHRRESSRRRWYESWLGPARTPCPFSVIWPAAGGKCLRQRRLQVFRYSKLSYI